MKRHQIDTKAVGSELPDHSSILEDVEDYINYDLSREGSDYVPSSEDEDLVNDENIESGKANLSPKGQLISKCPFALLRPYYTAKRTREILISNIHLLSPQWSQFVHFNMEKVFLRRQPWICLGFSIISKIRSKYS